MTWLTHADMIILHNPLLYILNILFSSHPKCIPQNTIAATTDVTVGLVIKDNDMTPMLSLTYYMVTPWQVHDCFTLVE